MGVSEDPAFKKKFVSKDVFLDFREMRGERKENIKTISRFVP